MKYSVLIAFTAILFSCQKEVTKSVLSASQQSSAVTRGSGSYQIQDVQDPSFNPCTNEYVQLSGTVNYRWTETITGSKLIYTSTYNYAGVTGIGLTSGIIYHGIGEFTTSSTAVWNGEYYVTKNSNFTSRVQLIAEGSSSNLTFISNFKIVFDANGNLVVDDLKFVYDSCQ